MQGNEKNDSKPSKVSEFLGRSQRANQIIDGGYLFISTIIIDILALVAIVAVAVSTFGVVKELLAAMKSGTLTEMTGVIVSTLTVFIFIEVLAVSVRYIKVHHIDVKDLIDVTLAIIFREVWVGLFSGKVHAEEIAALSLLIAVLGFVRYFTLRSRALGHEKIEEENPQ